MSLVPGVVYGAGFCHSKAWWRLFILAPPRVPDLASGRTLTALAAPSASSKVFSRNFSKGSHFVHKTPPSPSMWRKPPCAMQGGIFPCRSQEGQQDKMDPELFHSAPVNCAVLPRTFKALTPVSGECRFYLRTPTPLAIWPLLGHFSEIEVGTQVFSGKFDFNSHRRGS